MNDDAALLLRYAQEGDETAFAEVVHRQMGWVYAVALRRVGGERPLAEEVVQTVFAALAKNSGRFGDGRPVGPWLHRTVLFVSAKAVRSEVRRKRRLEEMMKDVGAQMLGEGERLEPETTAGALDEILDRARAGERAVLMLRFLENRSVAEIAERLRITEEAARKRIDRAVERLREALARRGIRSTVAAIAAGLAADGMHAAPSGLAAAVSAGAVKRRADWVRSG